MRLGLAIVKGLGPGLAVQRKELPACDDDVHANDYHPSVKERPAREALCWAALRPRAHVRRAAAAGTS